MERFDVQLTIGELTLRFDLWSAPDPGNARWRAARRLQAADGAIEAPHSMFVIGETPEAALGRIVAQTTRTLLRPAAAPALPRSRRDDALLVAQDRAPAEPGPTSDVVPVAAPTPLVTRADRAAGLAATIEAAIERLAEQLRRGHTVEFLEVLAFYGRFWTYSPTNALLIMAQCPHATRVAGMRTWNELGYSVKKGERAIWVWCPIVKREEDPNTGDRVESVVGFRPGAVFDASQLKEIAEKPLPEVFQPLPDDCEPLYAEIRTRVLASGITVVERDLPMGVQGVSTGGHIAIRRGLASRNRLLVLLHELAHELAHHGEQQKAKPAAQRELEAEATAFVVASVLCLEIPTSRDYLLNWRGTAEQLKASLGIIQDLVRRVLSIVQPDQRNEDRLAA